MRIHVLGFSGRDAEEGRIEAFSIVEEVSLLGDTVQNPCVKRTPLSSGPPSIRWNLAGRVYLLQQKVPECSWTVDPPGRPA